MKTKFLKYLILGLVMVVSSCSDENNDDLSKKFSQKEITLEYKVKALDTKYTKATVDYIRWDENGKNINPPGEHEVSLPFSKKMKAKVYKSDKAQIVAYLGEVYSKIPFVLEILVNDKVVVSKEYNQASGQIEYEFKNLFD